VAGCPHCDPEQTSQAMAGTALCFAVWASYEPPEGGVLICPRAHRETVFDLTADEWEETQVLLTRVRTEIDARVAPDGYNVGWNVLPVGGQRVDHAHLHIVPRWSDEPHAGKGIRWWIKQPENRRPSASLE
jgi:histidine triad (HIT) family protein